MKAGDRNDINIKFELYNLFDRSGKGIFWMVFVQEIRSYLLYMVVVFIRNEYFRNSLRFLDQFYKLIELLFCDLFAPDGPE